MFTLMLMFLSLRRFARDRSERPNDDSSDRQRQSTRRGRTWNRRSGSRPRVRSPSRSWAATWNSQRYRSGSGNNRGRNTGGNGTSSVRVQHAIEPYVVASSSNSHSGTRDNGNNEGRQRTTASTSRYRLRSAPTRNSSARAGSSGYWFN